MDDLPVIGIGLLVGGALQSATGFGFALVSAPLVFATLAPEPAIWLITALASWANLLTLATEGRRPAPLGGDVVRLLAWALPGAVVGALVLQAIDEGLLQVLVSVVVVASLAARRTRPHIRIPAPPAGALAGVLGTTTGTNGPPFVLYLLSRGARPLQVRDTLTVLFLVTGTTSALVLLATGTRPYPAAGLLAAGALLTAAGHLVGRRVFRRLAAHGYEAALVVVLIATTAGGLLRALG